MQGLNPITMQCTYLTPCGWCTKWDKKCDKNIGETHSSELDIDKNPKHVDGFQPIHIDKTCNNCVHFTIISSTNPCQYCRDMSNFSPSYDSMKAAPSASTFIPGSILENAPIELNIKASKNKLD